jgi:hypothetical protein
MWMSSGQAQEPLKNSIPERESDIGNKAPTVGVPCTYRGKELIVTCVPWKDEIASATLASPTYDINILAFKSNQQ